MKKILTLLFLGFGSLAASAQVFIQNFNGSTVATDYFVNGTDNTGGTVTGNKFTNYTLGGAGTISMSGGKLVLTRPAASDNTSIQLSGLSGSGTECIAMKFKYKADFGGATGTGQNLYLYFGDALGTGAGTPVATNQFETIHLTKNGATTMGVKYSSASSVTGSVGAFDVSQEHTIFVVLNNSGNAITYKGPDALDQSNQNIANRTTDVWVDNVKVLTGGATTGTSTTLKEFRMRYSTILASTNTLDDVSFFTVVNNQTLPVSFSSLSAKLSGSNVTVNWATESEANNDRFEIEASTDGKTFKTVKTVQSKNGNSSAHQDYQATVSISDIAGLLAIPALLALVGFAPMSRRRKFATLALVGFVAATSFVGCQKEGKDLLSQQGQGSEAILSGKKTIYIRIKQVDKDGTATYSNVVVAK